MKEVTGDRKEWKRMEKLHEWEKSKGHKWKGKREEQNEVNGATAARGFVCKSVGKYVS